ncbi:heme-binding protein [Brevundimonas sp.]|uniref:GlcG/HbpS family heme-binding protein n=1 Tax=Brevundimonas sp. TaxID=1871086 RepID=UPI00286CE316|nr:heme-binding protein [Brevundimonas sp.]
MKALILALALAAVAPAGMAQTPTGISKQASPPSYGAPISLEAAEELIDRAVTAARAGGHRLAIAIVEPNGELVAFARMDDTQYGSIRVAQRKAWTAARYRLATATMEERTLAGRIVTLANDDSLPIAGGVPIVVDGHIVGAIGVSGASAAEDAAVAAVALAAD